MSGSREPEDSEAPRDYHQQEPFLSSCQEGPVIPRPERTQSPGKGTPTGQDLESQRVWQWPEPCKAWGRQREQIPHFSSHPLSWCLLLAEPKQNSEGTGTRVMGSVEFRCPGHRARQTNSGKWSIIVSKLSSCRDMMSHWA